MCAVCSSLETGRDGVLEVKSSHSPCQEELPSADVAEPQGFAAAGGCGAESAPQLSRE